MKAIIIGIVTLVFFGCTYRNLEDLKKEEVPPVNCDTSASFTFTADIAPILNSSCGAQSSVCHSSSAASGGVVLDNYNSAKSAALSGSVKGSITGDILYSPMPKPGFTLSSCDRNKIIRWINLSCP